MIKILIVDSLETNNKDDFEVFVSETPAEIIFLKETVDEGDIQKDGNHFYIQGIIESKDVKKIGHNYRGVEVLIEMAKKSLKITEIGELEAEYEDLSSQMSNLEEQISENLEKQKKLM